MTCKALSAAFRLLAKCFRRETPADAAWRQGRACDPDWKKRIARMARHVPEGASVLDLGCGEMWLRELLPPRSEYYPVDCCPREGVAEVCDFNLRQFPSRTADVSFVSGCLEYMHDPRWFIGRVAGNSALAIVSYCTMEDRPGRKARRSLGWKNHLRRSELISHFKSAGMDLVHEERPEGIDRLFVFARSARGDKR